MSMLADDTARITFQEIKSFIDDSGRLKAMPSKRRKQLYAIGYISSVMPLERGRVYTEHEINEMIDALTVFHDPALLRRELVDLGFICRTRDCGQYWQAEQQPTTDELLTRL